MGICDPSSTGAATPSVNVTDISNRKQYGSQTKACYALISYNTPNAQAGIAFYDKYFQEVSFQGETTTWNNPSPYGGVSYQHTSSGWLIAQQRFGNMTSTSTAPSSNGTVNYVNATNSLGELGNQMLDTFSNLTMCQPISYTERGMINACAINSDHQDKSLVYFLRGNVLCGVNRMQPCKSSTLSKLYGGVVTTLPINTNSQGCGSYNQIRKQFVVLSSTGNGGAFDLYSYDGFDLTANKNTDAAFAAASKVPFKYSITLGANWVSNDIESQNPKVVLCDNGDIYVVSLHTGSSSLILYKITRQADGSYDSGVYVNKIALSTVYGRVQNSLYGVKQLQTRDGSAVMVFCQYYYYGSGLATFVIDKALSTYSLSFFQYADTGIGYQPVPYGDNGFAVYYAGNFYTSNYGGGYITGAIERNPSTGVFTNAIGMILLPYCPLPNTTNYPGFTQVNDYAMLEEQHTQPDKWSGRGI